RRIDGLTRAALGQRLLAGADGLLTKIASKHDTALWAFTGAASDWPLNALEHLADKSAAGSITDLGAPLERALQTAGDDPPVAVVLLTDGRHNADVSPLTKAAALGKLDAPVYSIVLGPRAPPPDVAIARLQAPA